MTLKEDLVKGLEHTMLSGCKVLDVKRLDDGELLGLKTWTSDVIRPGQKGYQLILRKNGLTMQFPTDWENYSETEVRQMYDSVNSIEDWYELREQ